MPKYWHSSKGRGQLGRNLGKPEEGPASALGDLGGHGGGLHGGLFPPARRGGRESGPRPRLRPERHLLRFFGRPVLLRLHGHAGPGGDAYGHSGGPGHRHGGDAHCRRRLGSFRPGPYPGVAFPGTLSRGHRGFHGFRLDPENPVAVVPGTRVRHDVRHNLTRGEPRGSAGAGPPCPGGGRLLLEDHLRGNRHFLNSASTSMLDFHPQPSPGQGLACPERGPGGDHAAQAPGTPVGPQRSRPPVAGLAQLRPFRLFFRPVPGLQRGLGDLLPEGRLRDGENGGLGNRRLLGLRRHDGRPHGGGGSRTGSASGAHPSFSCLRPSAPAGRPWSSGEAGSRPKRSSVLSSSCWA